MMQTLVLGLGNTLMGDDGIGVAVVERLQTTNLAAEIRNGGTGGLSLLETLKEFKKTVVVDAVDMGKKPGTLSRFTSNQLLGLPDNRNFSLHEMGLLEVLKVGQGLKEEFKSVIIIGVQPKDLNRGDNLSPEVEKQIPAIIEMVKKEVI